MAGPPKLQQSRDNRTSRERSQGPCAGRGRNTVPGVRGRCGRSTPPRPAPARALNRGRLCGRPGMPGPGKHRRSTGTGPPLLASRAAQERRSSGCRQRLQGRAMARRSADRREQRSPGPFRYTACEHPETPRYGSCAREARGRAGQVWTRAVGALLVAGGVVEPGAVSRISAQEWSVEDRLVVWGVGI